MPEVADSGLVAAKVNLPLPDYKLETQPGGMLFVLSSAEGSIVDEDKFNEWYDTDHLPLRRSCPGVLNAGRYKAADETVPEWLATYELENVDVLKSEPYLAQWAAQPTWEKEMLRNLAVLDRRVYKLLTRKTATEYDTRVKEGHLFQYVGIEPSERLSDVELDRWYTEEHVPMLSCLPGWLRSSRWELVEADGAAGSRPNANKGKIPKFLAIHEWDNVKSYDHPEYKRAVSTGWRNSIMERQDKDKEERRRFVLYKKFN